jgi:hypothetical protein
MRAVIRFILSSLLTSCFVSTFAQDTAKLIAGIRKEFKIINADSTLEKVTLTGEEFLDHAPDGGGELTGFYKAGQIRKIVRWLGLSNGNEILEFYFKNSQLIFVYEEFLSFVYDDKKQTLRFDTTEKSFTGRYYFSKTKLVDYVTTGHNRFENDAIDPEKTLLTEANDNKKILDRKKSNSR